jgi:hypothetical protein
VPHVHEQAPKTTSYQPGSANAICFRPEGKSGGRVSKYLDARHPTFLRGILDAKSQNDNLLGRLPCALGPRPLWQEQASAGENGGKLPRARF